MANYNQDRGDTNSRASRLPDTHNTSSLRLGTENDPFDDFDGVHFTKNRQLADTTPSNNGMPAYGEIGDQFLSGTSRKDLVYYPAPVPVMLNLPPKLSSVRTHAQIKLGPENQQSTVLNKPLNNKRDSSMPFRNSLGLKGTLAQKTNVSSLFDNILDATVAAPVLSVVNHSSSATKIAGHSRSASRLLFSDDENHSSTLKDMLQDPNIEQDLSDESQFHKRSRGLPQPFPGGNQAQSVGKRSSLGIELSMPNTDNPLANGGPEEGLDFEVDYDEDGAELPRASQYPHSTPSESLDEDEKFTPATLLAELESRKTQQRERTNKSRSYGNGQKMSTLLERDAIAQVKKEARRRGPVNLAWQADQLAGDEAEDDVPLAVLFANKLSSRPDEAIRMPGLLAMRDAEDNEPLRKRQERLKQKVSEPSNAHALDHTDENETLGQRRQRLRAAQKQLESSDENIQDLEASEAPVPKGINSISAILQSNPQKHSYNGQPTQPAVRGLLGSELPFGYQAQQQLHVNLFGHQSSNRPLMHQPQNLYSSYQYDNATRYQNQEHEFGVPFPYAPVNAEYLQQQQAILADQIERWRSSVW